MINSDAVLFPFLILWLKDEYFDRIAFFGSQTSEFCCKIQPFVSAGIYTQVSIFGDPVNYPLEHATIRFPPRAPGYPLTLLCTLCGSHDALVGTCRDLTWFRYLDAYFEIH